MGRGSCSGIGHHMRSPQGCSLALWGRGCGPDGDPRVGRDGDPREALDPAWLGGARGRGKVV